MARKHFLESMEREIDFQREYEKLEVLCGSDMVCNHYAESVNTFIEHNFLKWSMRGNYCSYEELREQLGFPSCKTNNRYLFAFGVGMNEYILYCEMILNLISDLNMDVFQATRETVEIIRTTIDATISKIGFEIKTINGEIMIVEQSAVAMHVVDIIPDISEAVIEYNHYLLKGNLQRKKELLRVVADCLEPKRKELDRICGGMSNDFFLLVNKMNIRHNNVVPNSKNYNETFANMDNEAQEKWYDLIYEQGLALIVMLEQRKRTRVIDEYKKQQS